MVASRVRTASVDFPSAARDRKSTRLNSSHSQISYAVFCLKKKNNQFRDVQLLLKIFSHCLPLLHDLFLDRIPSFDLHDPVEDEGALCYAFLSIRLELDMRD